MARSTAGTLKTTSWIDKDSARYIDRTEKYRDKSGSSSADTNAAHKIGWGLVNAIATNTAGRPLGSASLDELHRAINHDSNLRIKSTYGNGVLDERRDARIARAYVEGRPLEGHSTAERARIAYESASQHKALRTYATALGDMRVLNPDTGRSHYLRNHHKY